MPPPPPPPPPPCAPAPPALNAGSKQISNGAGRGALLGAIRGGGISGLRKVPESEKRDRSELNNAGESSGPAARRGGGGLNARGRGAMGRGSSHMQSGSVARDIDVPKPAIGGGGGNMLDEIRSLQAAKRGGGTGAGRGLNSLPANVPSMRTTANKPNHHISSSNGSNSTDNDVALPPPVPSNSTKPVIALSPKPPITPPQRDRPVSASNLLTSSPPPAPPSSLKPQASGPPPLPPLSSQKPPVNTTRAPPPPVVSNNRRSHQPSLREDFGNRASVPIMETSQMKPPPPPPVRRNMPPAPPPPPPARTVPIKSFEERFKWHPEHTFPRPPPFRGGPRIYPSVKQVERQRQSVINQRE